MKTYDDIPEWELAKKAESLPPREVDPLSEVTHYCLQCKRYMGYEWILGPVCGKCCRLNHRRSLGKR